MTKDTATRDLLPRILLTVLAVGFIIGLGYWAWAGLPWLALVLFVGGIIFLWWLWRPVVARSRQKS